MKLNHKICVTCEKEKHIDEFPVKSDRPNGGSVCKKCFSNYCMKRWKKLKIKAIEYIGSKCIDCDLSHPEMPAAIFEFHHLDPSLKEASWGKLKLKKWASITKELDKCVLLCANCHRIRHVI